MSIQVCKDTMVKSIEPDGIITFGASVHQEDDTLVNPTGNDYEITIGPDGDQDPCGLPMENDEYSKLVFTYFSTNLSVVKEEVLSIDGVRSAEVHMASNSIIFEMNSVAYYRVSILYKLQYIA